MNVCDLPFLGVGLGYRLPLHTQTIEHRERIDWLEVISDQYLYGSAERRDRLLSLSDRWPLVPHGVGMSIGTAAAVDPDYLERLARLVDALDAPWFSDHLAYTKAADTDVEQLTPLWFTEENLDVVCHNIEQVTSAVGRPFLLENITYYFHLPGNEMSEAEFTTNVLEETDTGLLLDVNNVWVNSVNLGLDPYEFLDSIPLERTVQVHLAGGEYVNGMLVDTHGNAVPEPVWDLLGYVLRRVEPKAILLEWDQSWPEFEILLGHLDRARRAVADSAALRA